MTSILSIQSHVAHGYVGNRAAVFPLQVMGFEVLSVNTVQFSNHPGYGYHTGTVFPPEHIADVLDGLARNGFADTLDAVLTGYMGSAALGAVVLEHVKRLRARRPSIKWCCDPVMGDAGPGFYVPEELRRFFVCGAVPAADIITPNKFELEALSGIPIDTDGDARQACRIVHDKGPQIILLTSLETTETPPGEIQMIASQRDGRQWIVSTPKIDFPTPPNGAGDMTSALFTGHILSGAGVDRALAFTAGTVFSVLEKTARAGQRELAVIEAQDAYRTKPDIFEVIPL